MRARRHRQVRQARAALGARPHLVPQDCAGGARQREQLARRDAESVRAAQAPRFGADQRAGVDDADRPLPPRPAAPPPRRAARGALRVTERPDEPQRRLEGGARAQARRLLRRGGARGVGVVQPRRRRAVGLVAGAGGDGGARLRARSHHQRVVQPPRRRPPGDRARPLQRALPREHHRAPASLRRRETPHRQAHAEGGRRPSAPRPLAFPRRASPPRAHTLRR